MSAEIPQPVLQVLSKLSKELNDVEKSLVELQKVTPEERESLPLLQRAKLDVMSAQIILKLYCTYSSTFGQNPDEDEENIGVYTRRIEEATKRIQEEEDRPLRPKIQKRAARSFVRSSLFDPSKQQENGNGKRRLLHEPSNPLSLLKRRIVDHFHTHHRRGGGHRSPLFAVCDKENRVVSCFDNFDSLLTEEDHVSRRQSDTYYVNSNHVLRGHTSAHQHSLIRQGLDAFLVVGDVYRRDEIDRTHYPAFHQMEVRLLTHDELFGSQLSSSTVLFDKMGEKTAEKQLVHTRDTALALQIELKSTLESLFRTLFGPEVEMRWVDAYFPFTHPSFELEVFHDGKWMEMLGCGVMEQRLLDSAGAESKVGWAFGMGLERLAMVLYIPISTHPQLYMDISFWLADNSDPSNMQADVMDVIRSIGGDLIEQVEKTDQFVHPKKKRTSQTFRITYRSHERALTKNEVNEIHKSIENELKSTYGAEIR
ncbi:Phenylalanyl-tRNA synthetase [Aphelenchoides besseyi]|nr:Phenylalanyl-tRNA synthetase [Aphelenchoides besseyi]